MTAWMRQNDDEYLHAYPDDDTVEVAACGKTLADRCEQCHQTLHTMEDDLAGRWTSKTALHSHCARDPVMLWFQESKREVGQ